MNQQFQPSTYNWAQNDGQQTAITPYHQMSGVFEDDSVVGFFQRHPKIILFLFQKQEKLVKMIILRLFHDYNIPTALSILLEAIPQSIERDNAQAALKRMHTAGKPMDIEGVPQTSVVETMELDGEHFIAHILEYSKEELERMQQHNHNMAMAHGYYHTTETPNGTAYQTPWGVTHEQGQGTGQWNFQAATQDPYGQQGYINQAPGGMPNPHNQRGGLASSILGLLTVGAAAA